MLQPRAPRERMVGRDDEDELVPEQQLAAQPGRKALLGRTYATSSWSESTARSIDCATSSTTRMSIAGWSAWKVASAAARS